MLFDLKDDPQELTDLGAEPAYEAERDRLKEMLFEWALKIPLPKSITEPLFYPIYDLMYS